MHTALIELHYLPSICYFSAFVGCRELLVEKYEHYEKQSYRNRCYIMGPHRVETLIVPVAGKHGKPAIREVTIDYTQKWLNSHWRTLQTGYGNAPFFEYYAPDLHDVLFKKPRFLYELNLQIMTMCLKWLKMEISLNETGSYEKDAAPGVLDLRGMINPKKQEGCNRFYKSVEYQQVFGSKFVPNLSLIDLIFNQGPASLSMVKASALK